MQLQRRGRGRRVGSRDERNFWRTVFVAGIGSLLFLATFATHPKVLSFGSSTKQVLESTSETILPRSLLSSSFGNLSGRRQLQERQPEECAERELCEGVECLEDEELEGACCLPPEGSEEFLEATECVTNFGAICPAERLCVAELIPASGVGAECLSELEASAGGAIIYFLILLYLFIALAIVCDDYFTYSLDMLADLLGLSSDVKGATFAAIGSSAPELFVSLADNVISNPPKSVGVGTIVGSAIFNILVIIGASAIVAGRTFKFLQLDYKPLLRDSFFYVVSICGLIAVAVTGEEARHFEGGILVLLYCGYLGFMMVNQKIFDRIDRYFRTGEYSKAKMEGQVENPPATAVLDEEEAKAEADEAKAAFTQKTKPSGTGFSSTGSRTKLRQSTLPRRKSSIASAIGQGELQGKSAEDVADENESYWAVLFWPMVEDEKLSFGSRAFGGGLSMWLKRFYWVLVLPINVFFRFTIPDARYDLFCEDKNGVKDKRKFGYILEFLMCIVQIAFLSHMLVFSAAKFGCIVGIAPSVMGLTVLAAGTSVPDMITSIILTKAGEGDAAVANSIGSNVFDILIGLGLPWLIAEFVFDTPAPVATGDIGLAIGFLFGVLVVLLIGLAFTKFRLNFIFGVALILLYVFYVLFELFIRPVVFPSE